VTKKQKQVVEVTKNTPFKGIKKLWGLLKWSFVLLFVWLLYCYIILVTHPFEEDVSQADAAIVLGAALWNERPSPALKERLNHALQLYKDNKVQYIIVSGGKGHANDKLSEAEGMKNYLIEQGVNETHIVLEQHATNTYENLLFTKSIIDKLQFQSVIIVSHSYHAYRTNKMAHYLNYKQYQVSGIESQVLNKPYHYTREVLAYSKWVLNSFSLKLGIYLD